MPIYALDPHRFPKVNVLQPSTSPKFPELYQFYHPLLEAQIQKSNNASMLQEKEVQVEIH
jgi:hypothetical protein